MRQQAVIHSVADIANGFADAAPGHHFNLYFPIWRTDWSPDNQGKKDAIQECRRARDTFWDVQVAKMTALGDSLGARIRPAVDAAPDSPLVRRARQRPQMA